MMSSSEDSRYTIIVKRVFKDLLDDLNVTEVKPLSCSDIWQAYVTQNTNKYGIDVSELHVRFRDWRQAYMFFSVKDGQYDRTPC